MADGTAGVERVLQGQARRSNELDSEDRLTRHVTSAPGQNNGRIGGGIVGAVGPGSTSLKMDAAHSQQAGRHGQ